MKATTNRACALGCRLVPLVLVLAVVMGGSAFGVTIVRVNGGGTQPGSAVGGGNLTTIFNAAADWWEEALLDTHTVTVTYKWGALGGSTIGLHTLTGQGGVPNRETSGTLIFDNDGTTAWFMDPTPDDNGEYTTFSEPEQDLGGGLMNVGRVHSGPTGLAVGRHDLLAVVKHEIGHALGLSSANIAFIAENVDLAIDITLPRPSNGASLPTISGAHLNLSSSLMFPSIPTGIRRLQSAADIVANGQISQFIQINDDPHPDTPGIPVLPLWGQVLLATLLLMMLSASIHLSKKRPGLAGGSTALSLILVLMGLVLFGGSAAGQGAGPGSNAIFLRMTNGFGAIPIGQEVRAEFAVGHNGQFRWDRWPESAGVIAYQARTGQINAGELNGLINKASNARLAPPVDDAAQMEFEFTRGGVVFSGKCDVGFNTACTDLLRAVDDIAVRRGNPK